MAPGISASVSPAELTVWVHSAAAVDTSGSPRDSAMQGFESQARFSPTKHTFESTAFLMSSTNQNEVVFLQNQDNDLTPIFEE
jgi:hypothetical protein